MRALVLILLLIPLHAACVHPQVTAQATSAAQGAANDQAGAESGAQSGSSAGVALRRGKRHVGITVVPAADGGLPGIDIDVDDDSDEVSAGAAGQSDGGATAAADAGAQNTAGGSGSGGASAPTFWTAGKLAVLGVLGMLVLAGVIAWKAKPPWLGWLWRFLGRK